MSNVINIKMHLTEKAFLNLALECQTLHNKLYCKIVTEHPVGGKCIFKINLLNQEVCRTNCGRKQRLHKAVSGYLFINSKCAKPA